MDDDFVINIDRFVRKAEQRLAGLPFAIGLDLLAYLKEHTPVVTGNLRASWFLKHDTDKIVISTGVEYARRVEYGFVGEDSAGRKFNQPGRGMVRQTVKAAPQIIADTIERLRA